MAGADIWILFSLLWKEVKDNTWIANNNCQKDRWSSGKMLVSDTEGPWFKSHVSPEKNFSVLKWTNEQNCVSMANEYSVRWKKANNYKVNWQLKAELTKPKDKETHWNVLNPFDHSLHSEGTEYKT